MPVDSRRVMLQPGFLLHYRPFRDSSLLLDVLTMDHGRLALVARGARSARSRLKGVLRPFLPLTLSWVQRSELGTLTGAEPNGRPLALSGDRLMSGYYLNELLLHFLHRHDPQPELYRAYRQTISALSAAGEPSPLLRDFELELLRLLGYGAVMDEVPSSGQRLDPDAFYEYRPEQGPVRVERASGEGVFAGSDLLGIHDRRFDDPQVLRAAGRLLRGLITHHLGGRELKSRKVLVDLHRGRDRMGGLHDETGE
jgi:DNA repair protein RecO (recombination protein O)